MKILRKFPTEEIEEISIGEQYSTAAICKAMNVTDLSKCVVTKVSKFDDILFVRLKGMCLMELPFNFYVGGTKGIEKLVKIFGPALFVRIAPGQSEPDEILGYKIMDVTPVDKMLGEYVLSERNQQELEERYENYV